MVQRFRDSRPTCLPCDENWAAINVYLVLADVAVLASAVVPIPPVGGVERRQPLETVAKVHFLTYLYLLGISPVPPQKEQLVLPEPAHFEQRTASFLPAW
jgi:hypothetical protein